MTRIAERTKKDMESLRGKGVPPLNVGNDVLTYVGARLYNTWIHVEQ